LPILPAENEDDDEDDFVYPVPVPELAEVEYYRRQWDCGLGARISAVRLHSKKRTFRDTRDGEIEKTLPGSVLLASEAHGKQMLFRFSNDAWLGVHLGMTGELRVEKPGFLPGKHDHLVLYQPQRALVFSDPRQFGRVRFYCGPSAPAWWSELPPSLLSKRFTRLSLQTFLHRHPKLPLKAALLLQNHFPGLGNWMADEILWQARLNPRTQAGSLTRPQTETLWRAIRFICRAALKSVSRGYSAFPARWLFHQRWSHDGLCPRHAKPLVRATVGGRTTAWCRLCQPGKS